MENHLWKKTIGTLISAIWLYTIAGIVGSITETTNTILNLGEILYSMFDGGEYEVAPNFADLIEFICSFLVILGYYLFFRSIIRFVKLQRNNIDKENANKIKSSYILLVIALITDCIPFVGGLISLVLLIIAYVKQLSGYKGLSKSDVLPQTAKNGLHTLYLCTIWSLVFGIIGCIPLIGAPLEGIASLVIFFIILSAWKNVKEGAPELDEDEILAITIKEPNRNVAQLGDYLVSIFVINVICGVLVITTYLDIIPNITFNIGYTTFNITVITFSFIQTLSYIIIYFKLYRSNNNLICDLGKKGIIILMSLNIIIFLYSINQYLGFFNSYQWFSYIFWAIDIIGLSLLAIGSNLPKALKIAIISYSPVNFMIDQIFFHLIMPNMQFEELQSSAIFYYSMSLIIVTIYFIFIYTQIKKWKTNSIGY